MTSLKLSHDIEFYFIFKGLINCLPQNLQQTVSDENVQAVLQTVLDFQVIKFVNFVYGQSWQDENIPHCQRCFFLKITINLLFFQNQKRLVRYCSFDASTKLYTRTNANISSKFVEENWKCLIVDIDDELM